MVDGWSWDAPRTRDAVAALDAIGATGRVLVVLGPDDEVAAKSFRNLQHVHVLAARELNAYDVLCSDVVVFTRATLPTAAPRRPAPDGGAAEPAGATVPATPVEVRPTTEEEDEG